MVVHGDTGGDGRILVALPGDAWPDIGANLLPTEYDDSCTTDGDFDALTAEAKLSIGLVSGGDIKLEIGGSRVIFPGVMIARRGERSAVVESVGDGDDGEAEE